MSGRNWLSVMFGALLYLNTKKIGAEVFGELWNVALEENEENKMIREKTNEQVLEHLGVKRRLLNNILQKKNQLDWSHSENKLPPSWCHWKTDCRSERNRKKKNTAPWWYEKKKKILDANGGSWRR